MPGPAAASFAPQVADLLKSYNPYVRTSAAEALGGMGPAAASVAPQVADLLKSYNPGVRMSAAETLGSMGAAAAGFALQVADLLKSSNPDVRMSAAEALEKLTPQPDPTLALRLIDASKSYQDLRGFLTFWAYLTGGAQETNQSRVKERGAL
jgi:HEAT repeat protein